MEPISIAIELASLAAAVFPLAGQMVKNLRRYSKYRTVQEIVQTQEKLLSELYCKTGQREWLFVIKLLDVSDVIMPLVVDRIWRRFFSLLIIAIPIGISSALTFNPKAGFTATNILDVSFLLINGYLPFIKWKKDSFNFLKDYFFNTDERAFLENVDLLHDMFYEYSVREAVKAFNYECDRSTRVMVGRQEKKVETEKLKNAFVGFLTAGAGRDDLKRNRAHRQ
jgi:hypothetical protein